MQNKLKTAFPILGAALLTMSSSFAEHHDEKQKHKAAHVAVAPGKSHGSDSMAMVDIYASYILWTARMDNMTVAMDGYNQGCLPDIAGCATTGGCAPCGVPCACLPENKLRSGFKIGLGMNSGHDNVDVMLRYTWWRRHSSSSDSCCSSCDWSDCDNCGCCDDGTDHQYYSPWTNWDEVSSGTGAGGCFTNQADCSGALVATGTGNSLVHDTALNYWNLKFNRIDLEMGRRFFHGQYCNMRAFGGLMGYWHDHNFNIRLKGQYGDLGAVTTTTELELDFKNCEKVWGVGPMAGFDVQYMFGDSWFVFTNMATSMPWSRFQVTEQHTYNNAPTAGTNPCDPCGDACACAEGVQVYNVCYDFYTVAPVLDSSLGLGWEMNSTDEDGANEYFFMITAAWEQQVFFDHNKMSPIDNAFYANGNLSMQGFTLGFTFGF
jgi:hypothetical protein